MCIFLSTYKLSVFSFVIGAQAKKKVQALTYLQYAFVLSGVDLLLLGNIFARCIKNEWLKDSGYDNIWCFLAHMYAIFELLLIFAAIY